MDLDEFEEVEVEDDLHIIVPVRDFRAIVQHAGVAGTELSTSYSTPGQPIKIMYHGDAMDCDFLLMTVGERGNPGQKMRGRRDAKRSVGPALEAASRRASAAPSDPPPSARRPTPPQPSVVRPSVQRKGYFEMRPSQMPPPPSRMMSESLFVGGDEDEWAPVEDEEEDDMEEDARLEWDGTDRQERGTSGEGRAPTDAGEAPPPAGTEPGSSLEPTQRLSDARRFGLFYDEKSY